MRHPHDPGDEQPTTAPAGEHERQAIQIVADDAADQARFLDARARFERRRQVSPLLSSAARIMLDDSLACVVGLLLGEPTGQPVYEITAAGDGRLQLVLDVTFDPAGINGFAEALTAKERT